MLRHAKKIITTGIIAATLVAGAGAYAMTTSQNSASHVPPYTGGAPISKVFYPADGSTVTITSTGAVIKQSPGHTAYREGWVNVADLNCINSEADLGDHIAGGTSNPYSKNSASSCATNTSPSAPQATTPTPSASASASANATANTSVVLAGSSAPAKEQPSSQSQPASSPAPTSATTALPNTGPGNVVAISGIATVLGTITHFIYQRWRYRTLA